MKEQIYTYIKAWDKPYPPSVRDITDGLEISSTSVTHYWLRKMKREGLICYEPRKARTIRIARKEASDGATNNHANHNSMQ